MAKWSPGIPAVCTGSLHWPQIEEVMRCILRAQLSVPLEELYKAVFWPLCVGMVENNFGGDVSVKPIRMVLRDILYIPQICSLFWWFNQFNLTGHPLRLAVLSTTPQGKIEAIIEDHRVQQAPRGGVSQISSLPQQVFLLLCHHLCLPFLGSLTLALKQFHLCIK